jgi:hypothetical protein
MVKFRIQNQLLLLDYDSEPNNEWIFEKFTEGDSITIKNTFTFSDQNLYSLSPNGISNPDYDASVEFILGVLEGDYFKIDKAILSTDQYVFIYKNIKISTKFFTAEKNISILKKIDKLVKEDIYIGGEEPNALPESEYRKILTDLPNSYELNKYVDARLSSVLRNYFDSAIDGEKAYRQYMNKKVSQKGENLLEVFIEYELMKYSEILKKLETMLVHEDQYNENQWQEEILQIILLLYPKYIHAFKEAPLKDTYYDTERNLDFLLVDSGGHVDIVEIKKPFNINIVTKSQYRDNYIPLRELSGTIMQIEKYIFNLNRWGKKGEERLTLKYKDKLPHGFQIKITNPNGIIIMGRDNNLNLDQKQDFEVIKRKYKNIVDILTYDELLRRLRFTIDQLKQSMQND